MAKIELFFPKLMQLEGRDKFTNTPGDKGGATKYGVTLATWRAIGYDKDGDGDIDAEDIKLLSKEDALMVLTKNYWNKWLADMIINQSMAELLVDWTYTSGKWGRIIPERILNQTGAKQVKPDGIVNLYTIDELNKRKQWTFDEIKEARITFTNNIVRNDPTQAKYLKGWLNRINTFKYIS